jgi:organic hydroperoxide reductase OsmC/OhrA
MSQHRATVAWTLGDGDFPNRRYSRVHAITLGEGVEIVGSPSPSVVPAPWSRSDAMDPEAAFVAALSACHMLWFLDFAAGAGLVVTGYTDAAEGTLGRVARGKMGMTRVVLRPQIAFGGARSPTKEEIDALHHKAHEACFIANSVTTDVIIEDVAPG